MFRSRPNDNTSRQSEMNPSRLYDNTSRQNDNTMISRQNDSTPRPNSWSPFSQILTAIPVKFQT